MHCWDPLITSFHRSLQAKTMQPNFQLAISLCPSGVADGVGGWRDYGIDASNFSRALMKKCESFVNNGGLKSAPSAKQIIKQSFEELPEDKPANFGNVVHFYNLSWKKIVLELLFSSGYSTTVLARTKSGSSDQKKAGLLVAHANEGVGIRGTSSHVDQSKLYLYYLLNGESIGD